MAGQRSKVHMEAFGATLGLQCTHCPFPLPLGEPLPTASNQPCERMQRKASYVGSGNVECMAPNVAGLG